MHRLLALLGCGLFALAPPVLADRDSRYLFGEWDGQRATLEGRGVRLHAHHIFDIYDDFTGAPADGTAYFGRQRVALDLDLAQLLDWRDSRLSLSGVHQYGRNYNRSRFGVFTNPSSIEGRPTTRLAHLFFAQDLFDGQLTYQVGKVDGVGEFGLQEYGSTFMNLALAYVPNSIFGSALPFDPAQKLGFISTFRPGHRGFYLKGGVFDSNQLDAYRDDDHGLRFDLSGPVAYAAEIGYQSDPAETATPGFIRLGVHYNTGNFTRYLGGGAAGSNHLLYLSAGRTLLNLDRDGRRHLDGSLTWTHAPADRNLYADEFTALLRVIGPFLSRPRDEVGLGLVAAFLSSDFSRSARASGRPAAREEYTIELTYKAALRPWLFLQPSLQAVLQPSGDPDRDAVWIGGFRAFTIF